MNMHHFSLSNCFAVQMCLSIMRIKIQVFVIILIDMQISLHISEIISTDSNDEDYTLRALSINNIALVNSSQMPVTK